MGPTAVAGSRFPGSAVQWRRFETALGALKKKYGFRVFHATEFKGRSGHFAGWSPQKCIALIHELSDLTANGLMHGAVLSVRNAEYDTYYRNNDGPRRLRLDTCYGLSFRLCVVHMIGEVIRRLGHDKRIDRTRLNIVLESGHRHSGDAARVFHEEMKALQTAGCDLLSGMTLADKDKCDPLMVADFLAHTSFMMGEQALIPPPGDEVMAVHEKATLRHLGFDPGGLVEYKASLIQQWEAKHPSSMRPQSSGGS
jgi:hypothetical protein